MPPTLNLNRTETCRKIRNLAISPQPWRFYAINLIFLAFFALVFSIWSLNEHWDIAISQMWYDPVSQHFPWQHNRWLDLINHRLLKDAVIAAAVILLLHGLWRRHPRQVVVALMFAIGPLVVGVLKAFSAHSCPWDLAMFGGHADSFPLFGSTPANSGPGKCFPGGHASSGFTVMGLFFLWWPERPRRALLALLLGIALGVLMGYGQVMRGAHFFSHNLWAGWWVWLAQLLFFACVSQWLTQRGIE